MIYSPIFEVAFPIHVHLIFAWQSFGLSAGHASFPVRLLANQDPATTLNTHTHTHLLMLIDLLMGWMFSSL